jgi:hypothetical protein
MAKVFAPPAGFDPPGIGDYMTDGRYDREKCERLEREFIERLTVEAKAAGGTGALVGSVLRFPTADSYAQYLVWSERPLTLVHLPLGDGWSIPAAHARGLRISDVRDMVERDRRMAEMFTKKREESA